ncbi:MAG: hypothetical protein ABR975_10730 [Vulcanimicrobiaceae bacterium]
MTDRDDVDALLTAALRDRDAVLPPLPPRVLDATLARVDATRARGIAERLTSGAWWMTPARYATAAVLVLGLGGAAIASYEAHEAAAERAALATAPATPFVFRAPNTGMPLVTEQALLVVEVPSLPAAALRAHAILRDAATTGAPSALRATLPAQQLRVTMQALEQLGTTVQRDVTTTDLRPAADAQMARILTISRRMDTLPPDAPERGGLLRQLDAARDTYDAIVERADEASLTLSLRPRV